MKRIVVSLFITILTVSMSIPTAYAGALGTLDYSVSATRVFLTEAGAGRFSITVPNSAEPYNGIQFEIEMPRVDKLNSVSYNISGIGIESPKVPPGGQKPDTYFFSAYVIASADKLNADLICTVDFTYTGRTEQVVTIIEIKKTIHKGNEPGNQVDEYISNRTAAITLVPYSAYRDTGFGDSGVGGGGGGGNSDATLSVLSISRGTVTPTLFPAFKEDIYEYTAIVENSVSAITVYAAPTFSDAKVTGNRMHTLSVGENKITVTVTAANGAKKDYIITVIRLEPGVLPPEKQEDIPLIADPVLNPGMFDPSNLEIGGTLEFPEPGSPKSSLFVFTDVNEGDWFYNDVYFTWINDLMKGTSETLFSPNAQLTRGMVVTVLYRYEGEPGVDELNMPFIDVPADEWYTSAVKWAADNEIVSGYQANMFAPNDNITREQLATILYRYQSFAKKIPSNTVAPRFFLDRDSISDYAKEAVSALVVQNIISGRTDGTFDPAGFATRAEFAAMLHRYFLA